MRTNIVIDEKLIKNAMKSGGYKTKKEAVEEGLKLIVSMKSKQSIRALKGKLNWTGNLDEMRTDS